MKKLLKRASLILLTVCAVFACAFAISACDSSPKYVFTLKYDDDTVCSEVYGLQICTDVSCYQTGDLKPDANGKITLSQKDVDKLCAPEVNVTVFSFHVYYELTDEIADYEVKVDGAKEYTITINKG